MLFKTNSTPESYTIFNSINSYVNSSNNNHCNIKNLCIIKPPSSFQRHINLYSRFDYSNIIINWNIPILPITYFPFKLFWIYNKSDISIENDNHTKSVELPIKFKTSFYKSKLLDLTILEEENRSNYFIKTPIKNWVYQHDKVKKKKKYKINSKILFYIKSVDIDNKYKLYCIESNTSSIIS